MQGELTVEKEIELSAEKLERSLFFKTISMKETRRWNEEVDDARKAFSIFDSSICDEDQESAYLKKTLSRVRRNKANKNFMHQMSEIHKVPFPPEFDLI